MKYLKIFVFVLGLITIGCDEGVKFAEAPVNKEIPESFTKRSIYPAGIAVYEFKDLVGNILLIKNDGDPIRIGVLRPKNYTSEVIPITDSYNYYKSRIQKGAEAKGSYLAFAANFKADQLAELELIDVAYAGIPFDSAAVFDEILNEANKWVRDHPKNDNQIKRIWIKSAVVTKRIYNEFTNVGVNAKGQVGDVVGVSTGVYHKDEESIKSAIIGFDAFDVDELVKQTKIYRTDPLKLTRTKAVEISRFIKPVKGKIRKK